MRKGINPEKFKKERNKTFFHRIIVPVFIPDKAIEYYEESAEVFEKCLQSIFQTVNPETTAVTVIDNGLIPELSGLLDGKFKEGRLDKIVKHRDNRGKVNAVLSEAKASYEAFLTITDADVFFFQGWERAVFDIYKNFSKAGVISPIPAQNLTFYKNSSIFFDKYLRGKINYGKKVSDKDCELFLKGMGNIALHRRNKHKYSWGERQYFIENNVAAVVGANHFVATYRREIFNNSDLFPEEKFKKGLEEKFLDEPGDIKGFYRLSTARSFAYHMGNKIENVEFVVPSESHESTVNSFFFRSIGKAETSSFPWWLRKLFLRTLKKWKNL